MLVFLFCFLVHLAYYLKDSSLCMDFLKVNFFIFVPQKGILIASDLLYDKMQGHDFTLQAFNHHNANVKDQKGTMIPCHAMSISCGFLLNIHNVFWKSNYFNHGTFNAFETLLAMVNDEQLFLLLKGLPKGVVKFEFFCWECRLTMVKMVKIIRLHVRDVISVKFQISLQDLSVAL